MHTRGLLCSCFVFCKNAVTSAARREALYYKACNGRGSATRNLPSNPEIENCGEPDNSASRDKGGRVEDGHRSGRPRATGEQEDRLIVAASVDEPFMSALVVKAEAQPLEGWTKRLRGRTKAPPHRVPAATET
ncbi:hypothetical protein HPB48_017551 [Haemaphysalis longicornis]|uniref:Secreted protein n=1 Tax=Haemaphysalis longicornis TaxID=44386 RepID=A0A9J6GIZ8_HAELO|nr:hypothetical protein HPB48_017551 [Haemaphysalis longicornis]